MFERVESLGAVFLLRHQGKGPATVPQTAPELSAFIRKDNKLV
jgi:hypothetical protein